MAESKVCDESKMSVPCLASATTQLRSSGQSQGPGMAQRRLATSPASCFDKHARRAPTPGEGPALIEAKKQRRGVLVRPKKE